MIQPYIGDEAVEQYVDEQIIPAYAEAVKPLDRYYVDWSARAVYDHATGKLSWPASCAKHTRECREALGLPVPPLPPVVDLPRLVVNGAFFALATGERWTAIQCSDFNLLNRWQHGEDIVPVLEQRRAAGFNLLRVWTLYDLEAAHIGRFLDEVAAAWVAGARSVSVACQAGAYRRRDDLLTDDLLRVYQRGDSGCIVEIRK